MAWPICDDCGDTATFHLPLYNKNICGDCLDDYPEDVLTESAEESQ